MRTCSGTECRVAFVRMSGYVKSSPSFSIDGKRDGSFKRWFCSPFCLESWKTSGDCTNLLCTTLRKAGHGVIAFTEETTGVGMWFCTSECYVVWHYTNKRKHTKQRRKPHDVTSRRSSKAGTSSDVPDMTAEAGTGTVFDAFDDTGDDDNYDEDTTDDDDEGAF